MEGQLRSKDFSRDSVKQRLLKTAAEIWGYRSSDMEGFDPILDMLFGACSVEFEKISHEISASQARSLEKLAELMIPEAQALPKPAHTVLHAQPSEPRYQLAYTDQFYFEKKSNTKGGPANGKKKGVYFSPVNKATILDCSLRYIAAQNTIYRSESPHVRSKIANARSEKHVNSSDLWLGIELNDRIKSIRGLCFYFDWNSLDRSKFRKILSHSIWSIADTELSKLHGLQHRISSKSGYETELELQEDITDSVEKQVVKFYNDSFVTIESEFEDIQKYVGNYPESFLNIFDKAALESIDANVLWIKMTFSQSINHKFLENARFAINCFPVINRRLHSSGRPFSLGKEVNIIPLNTDDYFLAVNKVHNKEGVDYNPVNLRRDSSQNENFYYLRNGNISRFDERNASNILKYIIELMRDESVAFKAWDDRLLSSDIKVAGQVMARLEQAVHTKTTTRDLLYFLLIKSSVPEDVWIEFWSTTGEFGNGIPTGTSFFSDSLEFKKDSVYSLNMSSGGRARLSSAEKVPAFKSVLLSRNKYITVQDFKAACYAELGAELKHVEVKDGIMIGTEPSKGFIRTIDIYLTLSQSLELSEDEAWNYCQQLKVNLEMKTLDLYNLRVFINGE